MKRVTIIQAFTLTLDNGSTQRINAGTHEMEDDIADHWYVIAHSDNPGYSPPKVGTPEYAREAAKKIARAKLIEAAVEQAAQEELDKQEAEQKEVVRRRIITNVETKSP